MQNIVFAENQLKINIYTWAYSNDMWSIGVHQETAFINNAFGVTKREHEEISNCTRSDIELKMIYKRCPGPRYCQVNVVINWINLDQGVRMISAHVRTHKRFEKVFREAGEEFQFYIWDWLC